MRRIGWGSVTLWGTLLACGSTPPGPGRGRPVASATTAVTSPPPSVSSSEEPKPSPVPAPHASPAPPDPAEPSIARREALETLPVPSPARTLTCGAKTCKVGEERCCETPVGKSCVGIKPEDTFQPGSASAPCWASKGLGRMPDEGTVKLCDESGDCPGAMRCCLVDDFPPFLAATCVKGPGACTYDQLCVTGADCPGGYPCRDGVCSAKRSGGDYCGGVSLRCSATDPVCCNTDPPRCARDSAACGTHSSDFACIGPSDCGPDQACYRLYERSVCRGAPPNGAVGTLCERAEDCDFGKTYAGQLADPNRKVRMVCRPDEEVAWLKSCATAE